MPCGRCGRRGKPPLAFCLLLLAMVLLPGCSGCRWENPLARLRRQREAARKKQEQAKKKKKPKKDFEALHFSVQPGDESISRFMVKPGHWVSCTQRLRCNARDFHAELQTFVADRSMQPLVLPHTRYRVETWRPASLPKGQAKDLELTWYVPPPASPSTSGVWLQRRLHERRGARQTVTLPAERAMALPPHQYLMVILSTVPDQFAFLDGLDSVRPPSGELTMAGPRAYYRVVRPQTDRSIPLPTNPLTWTGIAYIIWDDLPPQLLLPDQRQAMLDWLHLGGQLLLVSGPRSLDVLHGSFLDPYLPAHSAGTIELDSSAFDELNEHWSPPNRKKERHPLAVLKDRPLVGARLKVASEAQLLPHTGGLVVERAVGRGRIVATAFSLTDRTVLNWPHLDSFFNCCLLRRPGRRYSLTSEFGELTVTWADYPSARYAEDPRLSTTVRLFARDVHTMPSAGPQRAGAADALQRSFWRFGPLPPSRDPETGEPLLGSSGSAWLGVGAWNDASGVSAVARQALRDAAGISIPKADFVLRVMAVYLLVLVPINWALFRAIGRVEWAWIAAPIIAVLAAIAVVRLAQLDIGFARSRTEIDVLEAFGGYRRAHLTRYTALYSSLSTSYRLEFADTSALALPFADPGYELRRFDPVTTVRFRPGLQNSLEGFRVQSNSTGVLHCEEMFDLGGAIQLRSDGGTPELANGSHLTLEDVGLLRRTERGKLQTAWIGRLRAGQAVPVRFRDPPGTRPYLPQWDQSAVFAEDGQSQTGGQIRLWGLLGLATEELDLADGQVRLVGWAKGPLPGLTISPAASQVRSKTFVLVHLRPGELPPVEQDVNLRQDVLARP